MLVQSNNNSMYSLSYLYISSSFYHETTMQQRDQGPHNRETRRIDLTLQSGPNQHGTQKPRRTSRTNLSPPRIELQEPAQRHMVSRAQRETSKSKHRHPQFSATTRLTQELGSGTGTFETKQYSDYRFRLPPTPGMRLVQFNPRSALPTTTGP